MAEKLSWKTRENPPKAHNKVRHFLLNSLTEQTMPHTFIMDTIHRKYWIRLLWISIGSEENHQTCIF